MAETKKTTRKPRTNSTSKKSTGTKKTTSTKKKSSSSTTKKGPKRTYNKKTKVEQVAVEVKEQETVVEPEVVKEEIVQEPEVVQEETVEIFEDEIQPEEEVIEILDEEVTPEPEEETVEEAIDEELEYFDEQPAPVETVVVEELDKPVVVNFKEEDEIVNLNYKKPAETSPISDEVIPLGKDLHEKEERMKKKDKMVDLGILVIICGLFILIITTYLSFSIDLSYKVTNTGVVIALVVELVGIALVIANSFSRK